MNRLDIEERYFKKKKKRRGNPPVLSDISKKISQLSKSFKKPKKQSDFEKTSEDIIKILEDFGIEGKIVDVKKGPVVTSYEFIPSEGRKIKEIVALEDEIAFYLYVESVLITAERGRIKIEVPNKTREKVLVSEILDSKEYDKVSNLPLILGKDSDGDNVVETLSTMPHLLIGGSTGSGKSVSIHAMIIGLINRYSPNELKFSFTDTKRVELGIYENIPYLFNSISYEPETALDSLSDIVQEMEDRYELLYLNKSRNIESYNKSAQEEEKLPYIVVIIDEFADLMISSSKKAEKVIVQIVQKARAVGIHLILATQRPSVDVVTGLIKANIPSRISFKVSSKIDSSIILGQGGAENLLGMGDMLYLKSGKSKPIRIQGAFISQEEVIEFIES